MTTNEHTLSEALKSIIEHDREFAELEDAETMLVRIKEKAQEALHGVGYLPAPTTTTQTGHTPGPWTYRPAYDNGEPCGYVVQSGVNAIADVLQGEDDARLIAAAPDLLVALIEAEDTLRFLLPKERTLKSAMRYGGTFYDVLMQCQKAIAKAKGQL